MIRQVVGTDKTMLLTSFITHDFFNRRLMENGTFSTLIPRLIDVSLFFKLNLEKFIDIFSISLGSWYSFAQTTRIDGFEHE